MSDKSDYVVEDKDAPFNMSFLFYVELNKIWSQAENASINGDLITWSSCLRAWYRRIVFKLNKDQKKFIESKFTEVKGLINSQATLKNSNIINSQLFIVLDEINVELVEYMDKYKMIFPKIEIKDGYKNLYNRYGLGNQQQEGEQQ